MKYPCIAVDRESEVCRLLTAGAALGVGDEKAPSLLLEQETGIHLLHQVPIRSPPALPLLLLLGLLPPGVVGLNTPPAGLPALWLLFIKQSRGHKVYECLGVW